MVWEPSHTCVGDCLDGEGRELTVCVCVWSLDGWCG